MNHAPVITCRQGNAESSHACRVMLSPASLVYDLSHQTSHEVHVLPRSMETVVLPHEGTQ